MLLLSASLPTNCFPLRVQSSYQITTLYLYLSISGLVQQSSGEMEAGGEAATQPTHSILLLGVLQRRPAQRKRKREQHCLAERRRARQSAAEFG